MSDNPFIYIVTRYGCNSSPSDMWIPESKIFLNYEEAYDYFLEVSPSLDNKDNMAEQFINGCHKEEQDEDKDYIVIENRKQVAGYHFEERGRAKRPVGAVIARSIIRK